MTERQFFFDSNVNVFSEPVHGWPVGDLWFEMDFTDPDFQYDPYDLNQVIPLIVVLPIGGCGNGPRPNLWPKHRDFMQINRPVKWDEVSDNFPWHPERYQK
jgi:hypothetical protein